MNTNERESKNGGLLYPELSYLLMGILFEIHNKLGNKFQEKHYQRALEIELRKPCIPYEKEFKTQVNFEGEKLGDFFLDFVIDKKIILETKTIPMITMNDVKQVIRYLESTGMHLGIIVNFRGSQVEYRRVVK